MSVLQVSIIEGRNLGINPSAGDPYVKLKLEGQEAQTNGVKGVTSQGGQMYKWLKDFKLQSPGKGGNLQVAVKQDNDTVGAVAIPVGPVADAGTQVQWFKLRTPDEKVVGEICLVLRIINKATSSASVKGAGPARVPGARTPPKTPTSPRSPRQSTSVETPARLRSSDRKASFTRDQRDQVTVGAAPPAHTPSKERKSSQIKRQSLSSSSGGSGLFSRLPLVGAILAAFGVATVLSARPKFYEIQEGDTICAVGFCFNRNFKDLLKKNPQVVDPDKVFPGDKIRIS